MPVVFVFDQHFKHLDRLEQYRQPLDHGIAPAATTNLHKMRELSLDLSAGIEITVVQLQFEFDHAGVIGDVVTHDIDRRKRKGHEPSITLRQTDARAAADRIARR